MAGLDFKRATDLFLGTERELALALGIRVDELGSHRSRPDGVPDALLEKLGSVLIERGQGMVRVGELLRE